MRAAAMLLSLLVLTACGEDEEGFAVPECPLAELEPELTTEPISGGGFRYTARVSDGRGVERYPFSSPEDGLRVSILGELFLGVVELELLAPSGTAVHRAALWEGQGVEGDGTTVFPPQAGTWTLQVRQSHACGTVNVQITDP